MLGMGEGRALTNSRVALHHASSSGDDTTWDAGRDAGDEVV
jgi:hypothetical protein